MSRPLSILLALGLAGALAGCHHTHGVCDCEMEGLAPHGGPVLTPGPPPPVRPEPLQAMPKPAENPPPPPPALETLR